MNTHINLVGIIHLALGGLGLLTGVAVFAGFFLLGGVGGLAGLQEGVAEALTAFGVLGFIGLAAGVAVVALALPEALAGYGLLRRRPWAPMVALIVSFFQLFTFPIGTAIAAYTGWALLSERGQDTYKLDQRRYGRLT